MATVGIKIFSPISALVATSCCIFNRWNYAAALEEDSQLESYDEELHGDEIVST
jgi:hypothetical protein